MSGLKITIGVLLLSLAGMSAAVYVVVLGRPDPSECSPPDVQLASTADLTSAQRANASAIIAEGLRRHVSNRGIVIALSTASQESGFKNYANDGRGGDLLFSQVGIAASLRIPHDAVGSDHGSLGVFQQQWPWWGTMPDLMNPTKAAGKFYTSLLEVSGWQTMPVTVAAQTIQRSAYPNAYADDEAIARRLMADYQDSASTQPIAWTAPASGCDEPTVSAGDAVYPLPDSAHSVDLHNWGGHGSHWASYHTGTDLAAPCGTPVYAATAGTIVIRRDQAWAGPWLVQVSQGSGQLTTWYAHMRDVRVAHGEHVDAGQQIGEVGDLGNATGCHLHFEVHPHGGGIYQDGVDPSRWLAAHVGRGAVPEKTAGTGAGSFTIATFNTLGASHTAPGGKHATWASGATRTVGMVRLLDEHRVDVAGLQEFQSVQAREFRRLASHRYGIYSPPESTENSIVWRTDRWELIRAGTFKVPYFHGHLRQMPIVVLRDRPTGNSITILNVHNPADTHRYPHQSQWRKAALVREVAVATALKARGADVYVTGDFNDDQSPRCAFAFGRESSARCRQASGRIDWILGPDGAAMRADIDRSSLRSRYSDHPLVVARASS